MKYITRLAFIGFILRLLRLAWTTPKDWSPNEFVTATLLNTYVRDNQNALKAPPSENYECDESSDYTTSSTTFVDVDSTNLSLTLVTGGGDVMVGFYGFCVFVSTGNNTVAFDIEVDITREGQTEGLTGYYGSGHNFPISFVHLVTGLSAGSHTFTLQWKITGGTDVTLYAGAGTSERDFSPQFWAREVS